MDKRYVIGIGEALWDLLPEGAKLGGAPANFAYHVGQFGLPSCAISAIGRDELGDATLEALKSKGLEHIIERMDYPTGRVNVTMDANGVPAYTFITDPAWDNIPYTNEMKAVARTARCVCWGSLAQRAQTSRKTIQQFVLDTPKDCLRVFDINLRCDFYTAEVIEWSMEHADVMKINDEEIVVLSRLFNIPGLDYREKCQWIVRRWKLRMLVLTCGTNGSYVFTEDSESFCPTPKVNAIDTVGAGDSFTATFCASIMAGKTIAEAHSKAVKISAYVCTQQGAMPKLPKEVMGN